MRKKLLPILALVVLVASSLVGCSENPSNSSTLTIFSITEGDVLVMKAGTDDWTKAAVGTSLGVGDTVKTGDDSGAEITFFDGSTIELEADTQIEITSLDSSPDTDAKTITLMQTIGTTISRVTKLLDPASNYAIETPNGVAAVRGTTMIVTVEYVTPQITNTWLTNVEGDVLFFGHGGELQVPEGRQAFGDEEIIELVPLNSPPVAVSDSAVTDENTPVTVNVLNNDYDPDGDTLTVVSVTPGIHGGSVTNNGNDVTYTPAPDFTGADGFVYTVSDGKGGIDIATVTITINGVDDTPVYHPPVNYAPVAVDDSATADENSPVTINVLNNDSDIDGDMLTVVSVTQGHNGTVDYNASSVTYTPDSGFAGTDSFTYTVSDGNGGTDTATVTVTVTAVAAPAKIYVHVVTGPPTASIFIWDDTTSGWARDEDSGNPVDGTHHKTPTTIRVAAGHYYCVWVEAADVTYYVVEPPCGWTTEDGGKKACGYGDAGSVHPVPFSEAGDAD